MLLNNQRLVGNVGWRQNNQTFDGASITTAPLSGPEGNLVATYDYLQAVHRIFGEQNPAGRLDMDTHVANVAWRRPWVVGVAAYALLLKYDDLAASNCNNNSQTYGVRVDGQYRLDDQVSFVYAGEFARQSGYGNNLNVYQADYWLAEAGLAYGRASVKLGYNVLEGDGATDKFTTPLATGHSFNGWCDMFLNTPNNGLRGAYATLDLALPFLDGLAFNGTIYDFRAQSGGEHYGHEVDVRLEYKVIPFDRNLLVGIKFADFIGNDVANIGGAPSGDVDKFWVYTQYVF